MENSNRKSKSSINDIVEDIKVFAKLCSKEEDYLIDKRIFFFEENREVLLLQKESEVFLKYNFDYIFSDYENPLVISSSIKSTISNLVRNEKNICILTFGEQKLGKSEFLFGSKNKFSNDSFFKYTYDNVLNVIRTEFGFDNILIDIFKISNEKFVLDYRNITHDAKFDILEVINQIISDGTNTESNSTYSENSNESGHFIITIKFFRFVSEQDFLKEQREVEIIRSISFIDIEGFDSYLTNILFKNNPVSIISDPKNYTLLQIKNLIEAISAQDLGKYTELNSIFCSLLSEIMKIQNSTYFFFGFIDQNSESLIESKITLDLMNKFKTINPNFFFEVVEEMNLEVSNMNQHNNLREEYYIVENIFSEIIFYIEQINCKFIKINENIFDINFYNIIKDLSQMEKFIFLKNQLDNKHFNLEVHPKLKKVYESVLVYFNNRSKWKDLFKASEEIIKLNFSFKEEGGINETEELKSILKQLSKIYKNVEENENNSIFE